MSALSFEIPEFRGIVWQNFVVNMYVYSPQIRSPGQTKVLTPRSPTWWPMSFMGVTYRTMGEGLRPRAEVAPAKPISAWVIAPKGREPAAWPGSEVQLLKNTVYLMLKFSKESENWVWRLLIENSCKTEPVRSELNGRTFPLAVSDCSRAGHSLRPGLLSANRLVW